MSMIFIFLIITFITLALATLFKKEFVVFLPSTVCLIIIILYIAGLLGNLLFGMYAIFALTGISIIFTMIIAVKTSILMIIKKNIKVGFILYVVLFLLSYWMHLSRTVISEYDAVTHWALVVKNMVHFDRLHSIYASNVLSKTYPPALGLFQYFYVKIYHMYSGVYGDAYIFRAMTMMYFAFVLPIFNRIEIKDYKKVFLYIFLLLVIPTVISDNFYNYLNADSIIGIVCMYVLVLWVVKGFDILSIINISLVLSITILMKPNAMYNVGIVLMIIFIDIVLYKRQELIEFIKKNKVLKTIVFVFPLMIPIFTGISWLFFLKNIQKTYPIATNLTKILNVAQRPMPKYSLEVARGVIIKLWTSGYHSTSAPFALSIVAIYILLVVFSTYLRRQMPEDKRFKTLFAMINIGFIINFLFRLYLYIKVHAQEVGATGASLERYMSTYLLFMFLFYVFIVLKFSTKAETAKLRRNLISVIIIFCLLFSNIEHIVRVTIGSPLDSQRYHIISDNYSSIGEVESLLDLDNDRVFLICSNENLEPNYVFKNFYLSRYKIAPIKLNEPIAGGKPEGSWSYWYLTDITTTERRSNATAIYSLEVMEEILFENFTHVYIEDFDDRFISEYGQLFIDSKDIAKDTLYSVDKNESSIKLVRIN